MPALAKAIKAKPRVANGGTTAPRSAAGGIGVYNNRNLSGVAGLGQAKKVPVSQAAIPGAAAPPAATPTPWDSAYEQSTAGAQNRYVDTINNLGVKKLATEQEYGVDPGYNDYKANPYSRAAALEDAYQRSQRASANSLASSGQGYSGASQNAETYNREHDAQERDALEKAYRSALQQYGNEEAEAGDRKNEEDSAASWKRIENASGAELEPVGGGSSGALPAYLQKMPSRAVVKNEGKKKKISVSKGRKAK